MTTMEDAARRPLSFLFVVPRFHTNMAFAVRGLAAAGHKVTVVCPHRRDNEDYSIVTPVLMPKGSSWRALAACMREAAPDLVVLRGVPGLSGRMFFLALAARARVVAYNLHPDNRHKPLWRRLRDVCRGRPWRRLTPVRGLGDGRRDASAVHIPFPVETADTAARAYAPGGVTRILCVGKLSQPRKRHLDLIAALEPLHAEFAFTLTIVGASAVDVTNASTAYLDRVRALGADGALAGRVTVRADVPFTDMAGLYRDHDLCVLPADGEWLGAAPLEGTAHGCVPIVSTGCGCAGTIPATAGAIFPTGDIAALRAVLAGFLADPDRLARAGAAARQLAVDELAMSRYVQRMEALATGRPPV